jgi:hypothetical protein
MGGNISNWCLMAGKGNGTLEMKLPQSPGSLCRELRLTSWDQCGPNLALQNRTLKALVGTMVEGWRG